MELTTQYNINNMDRQPDTQMVQMICQLLDWMQYNQTAQTLKQHCPSSFPPLEGEQEMMEETHIPQLPLHSQMSFDSLLCEYENLIGKKGQGQKRTPKLLYALYCHYHRPKQYVLPLYVTFRVEVRDAVKFMRLYEHMLVVVDSTGGVKVIDVHKRTIVVKKKLHVDDSRPPITGCEWLQKKGLVMSDKSGCLKTYIIAEGELKQATEHKPLQSTPILCLLHANNLTYTSTCNTLTKYMGKSLTKQQTFGCSGYSQILKVSHQPSYIIGLGTDRKEIWLLDEGTGHEILLFQTKETESVLWMDEGANGLLLFCVLKRSPEIHQLDIVNQISHKQLAIKTQKPKKLTMCLVEQKTLLCVGSGDTISFYSASSWQLLTSYSPENSGKKKIRIGELLCAGKKLLYTDGHWINMMEIQERDLVSKPISQISIGLQSGQLPSNRDGFLSLIHNLTANYRNLF